MIGKVLPLVESYVIVMVMMVYVLFGHGLDHRLVVLIIMTLDVVGIGIPTVPFILGIQKMPLGLELGGHENIKKIKSQD